MRVHITIVVTEMDHPHVETEHDEEDEQWTTIMLTERVSICGDDKEIRRWVRELAMQVAGLPE